MTELKTVTKDPICGMTVDAATAIHAIRMRRIAPLASPGAPLAICRRLPPQNPPLHTHQVTVVAPEKTLRYQTKGGMPNACAASCHGEKVDLWGYGMDAKPVIWNESTDVKTATKLMEYYGPNGKWWRRSIEPPAEKGPGR